MWMCTSCYNCIVRCPRELPITHIMHGLAHYAKRLGLVPKNQPTAKFAQLFWDNLIKKGRVNELKLGMALYFMNGFGEGVKTAMGKQKLGLNMMKTKRMNPMEALGGHAVKDLCGFQKIIAEGPGAGRRPHREARRLRRRPPMAKREYSFYPGCSSQKGASSSNYMNSVETMCEELDIQLNEIPDWNCCAASIGYAGGGELPRLTLSARNIALSEEHNPGQDIVATCAACWLSTREAAERLEEDESLMAEANQALAEAGLKLKNETPIKHMVEVLIEDIGYDAIGEKVKKPLEGIKIAGYVGCQTNRPFGIAGESFENPKYLDKLVETLGGDSIPDYEKKVQCCGGALAFSEPEKSQEMIKGIIESAYDHGADMIVTPCPVCQMNVEVYQDQINATYGTKFKMPVVYYSTLMSVAFGRSAKDAALDGQIIPAKKLDELAAK